MREKIRVTLLANAGILLEGTGARLLIDGLYDPAGTEFQCKRAQFSQKTRFLCQRCDGCKKMHK